jgi:hypothetical protein
VAITILYDAFRHHATDFTSIKDADRFRTQNLEMQSDEAQEDAAKKIHEIVRPVPSGR